MKIILIFLLLLCIGLINFSSGYRILGIYGMRMKSHFILLNQLFKGLAKKGHQVDFISTFPDEENYPNCSQIFQFPNLRESHTTKWNRPFDMIKEISQSRNMRFFGEIAYEACKNMGLPEFLKLARNPPNDPPYDIIITQMWTHHCFMILGHLWKIPVISVSTTSLYPWMHDMIGNPENIAFSPNNMIPIPDGNSLWTRYWNAYYFYLSKFWYWRDTENQNELLQKYFGPNAPEIKDLERSVALVLLNTYFPVNGVKPMTTNVIEVGGLHIQNDSPELSGNLKEWLDDSKHGVIYFNLGSILKIEWFPEETLKIVFESLRKLAPKRVLMRVTEPERLTVKIPDNFYTLPWIPQAKVLQHPNIKLFITHGGLLGTQEAIYYGIPMVCLPIAVDQSTNANNYAQRKIATTLDIFNINQEQFDDAISEVLNNSIYKKNVMLLSRLFRDRPLNAMDTATFWIEFVVRNGKDILRSPAMDLTWWQVALLDVLAITLLGLFIILFIIFYFLKFISNLLLSKKSQYTNKMKKLN